VDPQVVHCHHPYLLGASGVHMAARRHVPSVFTYHTRYEYYTHYLLEENETLQHFVVNLATGFCNLVDHIIAPSESIEDLLRSRGVQTEITAVPTGVDLEEYSEGDGAAFRQSEDLPPDAFICGIVSRLAPEKNVEFLCRAVARYLQRDERAHFVAVGYGSAVDDMKRTVEREGVADRAHFVGKKTGQELVNAYHSFDAFVFASHTETQGMVLVEALAAGCPLVALDAPGAREVVQDGENGRLIMEQDEEAFADGLAWVAERTRQGLSLDRSARQTAEPFDTGRCVDRVLSVYESVLQQKRRPHADSEFLGWVRQIQANSELWTNRVTSLATALMRLEGEGNW
jgi:glycosyltransferase involved in cell wall biosynthesis